MREKANFRDILQYLSDNGVKALSSYGATATVLNCSPKTVQRLVNEGKLHTVKRKITIESIARLICS